MYGERGMERERDGETDGENNNDKKHFFFFRKK